MDFKGTKKITKDKSYLRPEKTYQEMLSNQEIREKLKEYRKIDDIRKISIGTHIRYFAVDSKTKEKVFRLGGNLNKIDPEGRFVILSNGTVTWSVQIPHTIFYAKMSEAEFKEELKKELKKEIMTEVNMEHSDQETEDLKKEIKLLKAKMDKYKSLEKENNNLIEENKQLNLKIAKIEIEIKKMKGKK